MWYTDKGYTFPDTHLHLIKVVHFRGNMFPIWQEMQLRHFICLSLEGQGAD